MKIKYPDKLSYCELCQKQFLSDYVYVTHAYRRFCSINCKNKYNGSFIPVHSEDTKNKISKSVKVAYQEGRLKPVKNFTFSGHIHTKDTIDKMKVARAKQIIDGNAVSKGLRKYYQEHPEAREKARQNTLKIYKENCISRKGVRNDLGLFVRSTWEANFIRILNYLSIKWIYEPKSFRLNKFGYIPDFYLSEFNLYIEIKGYMSDLAKEKIRQFRILYPEERLVVIDQQKYKKLETQFKNRIENWEQSRSSRTETKVKLKRS